MILGPLFQLSLKEREFTPFGICYATDR